MLLYPSTLAGGYKSITLNGLHKYTQANRAYCFTVARIHLVLRARIVSLYPSVRALTSTARTGINSLIQWAMVGRGGVEPPFSVFQTGAPTVYATYPFKIILDAFFSFYRLTVYSLKKLLYASLWRRAWDSNPATTVLETAALPLR